jgi:hypothetical protein
MSPFIHRMYRLRVTDHHWEIPVSIWKPVLLVAQVEADLNRSGNLVRSMTPSQGAGVGHRIRLIER